MTFDGKAFGAEIVSAVKAHVSDALEPILRRIEAIEQKINNPDVDEDDLVAVKSDIESLRKALSLIPEPAPLPEIPDVAAMIAEAMKSADDQREQDAALVQAIMDEHQKSLETLSAKFEELPQPETLDMEAVRAVVKDEVCTAVSALPAPQDGKSVTLDDVAPLIEEAVSKAVSALPAPKDGCGIKELLIDRSGHLVATMEDGRIKDLGPVVGSDGEDADMATLERLIAEKVAAIPVPKDGLDGVGFDDMTCDVRDDGVYLVWEKGDIVKEARLPIPLDMGVYKPDATYKRGACVTWGGSVWIAQKDDPSGKPDSPDSDWRLAVKRGRDAKGEKVSS